jgi:hypothetical protein
MRQYRSGCFGRAAFIIIFVCGCNQDPCQRNAMAPGIKSIRNAEAQVMACQILGHKESQPFSVPPKYHDLLLQLFGAPSVARTRGPFETVCRLKITESDGQNHELSVVMRAASPILFTVDGKCVLKRGGPYEPIGDDVFIDESATLAALLDAIAIHDSARADRLETDLRKSTAVKRRD